MNTRSVSFLFLVIGLFCLRYTINAEEPFVPYYFSTISEKNDVAKDGKNWQLCFEPLFGIRYGHLGEHLLYNYAGEYRRLSYLEWEEKPVWYGGGELSASYRNLNGLFYLTGSIPGRTGSIYDSDWVELDDMKTDYSISENTLNSNVNTGWSLSYTFSPSARFKITPLAEFDFEYISLSAKNGYGWYADESTLNEYSYHVTHSYSYDSDMAIYFPEGNLYGVDYKRYTYSFWVGSTFSFTPIDCLKINVSPSFSPYTWIVAIDHHNGSGSGTYYKDEISGWLTTMKLDISLAYHINDNYSLILDCSATKSSTITGDTYTSSSESSGYSKLDNYEGGASFEYVEASLGLRIKLL